MMAVDGALAEAFKLHMKQRSQKKTKKGVYVCGVYVCGVFVCIMCVYVRVCMCVVYVCMYVCGVCVCVCVLIELFYHLRGRSVSGPLQVEVGICNSSCYGVILWM